MYKRQALAEACASFGLDLTVYMVKGSYNQKPYRKDVMNTFGEMCIRDRDWSGDFRKCQGECAAFVQRTAPPLCQCYAYAF